MLQGAPFRIAFVETEWLFAPTNKKIRATSKAINDTGISKNYLKIAYYKNSKDSPRNMKHLPIFKC